MYFPILSSIFAILAFNTKWYFLVFTALVPIFLFFIQENKLWRLLVGTALFRLIFAFGTVYFVVDPFLYGLSIFIFMGLPISFFMIRRYSSEISAIVFLPILWTFWDYLEAQYTLLPMTIMMLGNPLANSPFLGLSRFGGIIGLTFFAALINLLFVFLFFAKENQPKLKLSIISILFIFIAGWWISYFVIKDNKNDYLSKERILSVEILSVGKVRHDFDNQLASLPINDSADLLIVPENLYKSDLENSEKIINFYKKTAVDLDIALNVIALRRESGRAYKSSFLFSRDGNIADIYDKNYLTITSEYWPFINWRPFYFNSYFKKLSADEAKKAIFDKNYQLSKGLPGVMIGNDFSFAAPICGEAHYPGYMKELNQLNPDFILHNSNNDWIVYGLGQYLKLTNRLRTIEAVRFKKPIIVSGIKEYAGIFYPDGSSELGYPQNGLNLTNIKVRF